MSVPVLRASRLNPGAGKSLLLVGPSLGTSSFALWGQVAECLVDTFDVVGWDLPGHGSSPAPSEAFTMAELAAAVAGLGNELGAPYLYAGCSLGGCVGLQLLLDHPDQVTAAVLLNTGARIGDPGAWLDRAELVRAAGTSAMVKGSARRWFAPGFIANEPDVASSLLESLRQADRDGYARCCEALAGFDVRDRLSRIEAPVCAVAGGHDTATPLANLGEIVDGVHRGRQVTIESASHLSPAETPDRVAELIRQFSEEVT